MKRVLKKEPGGNIIYENTRVELRGQTHSSLDEGYIQNVTERARK